MTPPVPSRARFSALQQRNFRLLWAGLLVSNIGTWMQNVASGWLILQLTDSPLWLGLLGLSFAIPMIILPLIGGAITDRVHRIRLLYFTQSGMLITSIALAALTWLGHINAWHILVTTFIQSVLLAFDNPTRQAMIPDLVPPQDLLNAISLNSATYNGAALVGPALAGALLAPLGAGWLFFLNGVSFLAVIAALAGMRGVRAHSGGQPIPLGKSISAGLSFAWNNHQVRALLLLSALAGIFGRSYQSLLPVFARDIWSAGPQGYGLLLAAAGAGALIGAFGLAATTELRRQGAVLVSSGLIFCLSIIAFALSPNFWMGFVLLLVGGITSTMMGAISATFIQVAAPHALRGRVMSLYAITLIGLPSLGALGVGAFAEWLGGLSGAPHAVLLGAVLLGITLLITAPMFWRQDAPSRPKEPGKNP